MSRSAIMALYIRQHHAGINRNPRAGAKDDVLKGKYLRVKSLRRPEQVQSLRSSAVLMVETSSNATTRLKSRSWRLPHLSDHSRRYNGLSFLRQMGTVDRTHSLLASTTDLHTC